MAKKRPKPLVSAEETQKFERYFAEMDDVLEFFAATAGAAGFSLDYSLQSLEVLEKYLLSDARIGVEPEMDNWAARYLGEVFRKNVGGKWELCLEAPNYLYFKLPVLAGYARMPIELS